MLPFKPNLILGKTERYFNATEYMHKQNLKHTKTKNAGFEDRTQIFKKGLFMKSVLSVM